MSSSPANLEVATDHHLFGSDVASDESEAAPDDTTAQPTLLGVVFKLL